MSAQPPLEVVCPAGVHEGGMITVRAPDGGSFEVAVPAGVSEGQTFLVNLTDGYGGLGAVAAELIGRCLRKDPVKREREALIRPPCKRRLNRPLVRK